MLALAMINSGNRVPYVRHFCLTLTLAAMPAVAAAQAATWTIDPGHSAATFTVRHMIVANVKGEFAGPVGTATFDPKDLSALRVEATIDARTINTRNPDRDKDLRSELFFDVAKYPKITFKSRSVTVDAPGRLKVLGDLTIKGITKQVTLDVEGPTQEIKDIWGSRRIGATATTTINRRDFNIVYNRMLEGGGAVVGDQISITLDIELTRNQ
ncbi:MAG TPA: YceI family protein [Vicinamibacterales bacterium]|nr:YceI family protein [Vicinamibacterales bacterium]